MTQINPYLNFNGNTEEAFNFYKSVFGGEFAMVQRFGEMPGCDEMKISENEKDKIMHIALPIGNNILMAIRKRLSISTNRFSAASSRR